MEAAAWNRSRKGLADLEEALPPQYPFLQTIKDSKTPRDVRLAIRGDANNRGDVAPRHIAVHSCARGAPKAVHQRQRPAGTRRRQSPIRPIR